MALSNPLILTKFYLPQLRREIVPRPRLVDKLDFGLRGKITIVSAPAGYGKTTIVSSWIQQVNTPVAWLSLDEQDNHLPRFLHYLIAAIQQIDRSIGVDILDALGSSQTPQVEILLTLLINEIAASDQRFILILDDCHEITNFEIFEALEFFIEHQPAVMHVVFIGRLDPSITLSRLRVAGDLTEIRSADLKFTKMESTAFLNDSMKLDLTVDEITTLTNSAEGWIAGLQLAGLSLLKREDRGDFILAFSGVHQHLFDYLMDEVLSQQSMEIREFLFRTSILDKFNASLCNYILEITSSDEIIQELEAANLFILSLDDEHSWFRYHHLFRDFLALCLVDDQPEIIPSVHKRAANWYESHDSDTEAFHHLILAEDYESAALLLERKAKRMMELSELAALSNWVANIPSAVVDRHPRLGIYHTWALRLSGSPYDLVDSKIKNLTQQLDALEKGFSTVAVGSFYEDLDDELRNLKAHLFGIRAFQGIYSEQPSQAIEMAEEAKKLRPDENFTLSSLDFALGWAHRLSGDLTAAYRSFLSSSDRSMKSGNTYMAVSTLCRGAFGQVLSGRLSKGKVDFQKALQLARHEDGRLLPVAGYPNVYLGGINYEWNNLDIAKDYVLEGIQLSERVGLIYDQVIGYNYLTRVFLAKGDVESAQDACQSANELSLQMRDYVYTRRWAEDCQVRLWVLQGEFEQLERWVHSTDLQVNTEPDFKRDIDQIILARALVALARDRPKSPYLQDALILLSKLENFATGADLNGKLIEILALQSMAYLINEQEEHACISLYKAISLAEPEGYRRTFVDEGKSMEFLLKKLAKKASNREYIQEVLGSFESFQVSDQEYLSLIDVDPLSSREIEVMKMLATDLSGPKISEEMNIALSTLRFHTRNIYGKLMVNNRRSAVRRAKESHLI